MKPVVDRLSQEYEGRVEFRRYDVDTSEEGARLMSQWGAQYVPTFIFLDSDGTEVERVIGEASEQRLRSILDSLE